MTIAIGAKFSDGIMLCADAEYTHGESKYTGRKVLDHRYDRPHLQTGFTFSGSVQHAKKAIRLIKAALAEMRTKNKSPDEDLIVGVIEKTLEDYWRSSIVTHVDYEKYEGPRFSLLVGWSNGKDAVLYQSFEDVLEKVDDYALIGTGASLARYLLNLSGALAPGSILSDIALISLQAIAQVKQHVVGCGKHSDLIVIRNDGTIHEYLRQKIVDAEALSEPFYKAMHHLIFAVGNLELDNRTIELEFKVFKRALMNTREQRILNRDAWETFLAKLGMSKADHR